VDVRIIAAANKNLSKEVYSGRFRNDLYFRLNVLNIHIPPLRDRSTDIPLLVEHFIQRLSRKYHLSPLIIPARYLKELLNYPWPGNVRQLRSFLEQLVLLCGSGFDPDIFSSLSAELAREEIGGDPGQVPTRPADLKNRSEQEMRDYEARVLWRALVSANFSKKEAARNLGVSRTTLWRKLKRVGME
jgi:transcriptional regulator with PAS, ATPase and Fis domain